MKKEAKKDEPAGGNLLLPAGGVPKYEDLKDGEIYLYRQSDYEWVKAKIHHHYRGSLMVEILEGRLKGKDWYLFPTSMDRLRPVAACS